MEMKKDIYYIISFCLSILLIIGGFLLPPMGVIDNSVLIALGLLDFLYLISELPRIINGKTDIKFKHGETEIELNNPDN